VCDIVNKKEKVKEDEAKRKARKIEDKVRKRFQEMVRNRAMRGRKSEEEGFLSWRMNEMKTYIQYKKEKEDLAMPNTLVKLRERCVEVRGRKLPTFTSTADETEEHFDGFQTEHKIHDVFNQKQSMNL